MFKPLYNFRIGRRTFNLTKPMLLEDRHVGCAYCNYGGCTYATKGYIGHVIWTFTLLGDTLKHRYKTWIKSFNALDYSKIEDVEVDGIDTRDYPDFCDAFIASATYKGRDMTETELERLNEDSSYVYDCVQERLF